MIEPALIEPESLLDDSTLRQVLGLTPSTLANARRSGTLRHTRQGKRVLYKGAWVLDWLEIESAPATTGKPRSEKEGL
jgi:hypothetical protein